MNDNLILITRPDHDDTTFYLFRWCEETIETANRLGRKIIDLKKRKANRKEFEKVISKKSPTILLMNGHGTENSICGHGNETLLDIANISLLKFKIAHAISCASAKVLGYHAVKENGAKAFIGYKSDFIIPYDLRQTAHPERDRICQPVMESALVVGISLVRGKTAGESYNISQQTYEYWIRKLVNSRELEAPHILKYLLWNRSNQVLFENSSN